MVPQFPRDMVPCSAATMTLANWRLPRNSEATTMGFWMPFCAVRVASRISHRGWNRAPVAESA